MINRVTAREPLPATGDGIARHSCADKGCKEHRAVMSLAMISAALPPSSNLLQMDLNSVSIRVGFTKIAIH